MLVGWEIRDFGKGWPLFCSPDGEETLKVNRATLRGLLRRDLIKKGPHLAGESFVRYIHADLDGVTALENRWIEVDLTKTQILIGNFLITVQEIEGTWNFRIRGVQSSTSYPDKEETQYRALITAQTLFEEALEILRALLSS